MNASWRFGDCASAIKGGLVRRGAFIPAHIRENNRSSQSTLVSPTRLADRASMRDSITLDAVRVFFTLLYVADLKIFSETLKWSLGKMTGS
jgi:hypothetical protein